MSGSDSKTLRMGTAPMFSLIMAMSLPSMFSMMVQAMYNVVDSYFVAKIDAENAIAAVSVALPLQMLMIAVAVGTSVGVNSLIARRLGQKDLDAANKAASHGIVLAVLSWLVFLFAGIFLVKPFIRAFAANETVYQMGVDYASVVMIFSLGIFIDVSIEKTLQATGNMIYPMVFQLTGAVTNIILDPIMIFGLLGFPAMGVKGAAVATVIGQLLSAVYAACVMAFKTHTVKITLKGFKFHAKTVRDIYAVGFPGIIMQSIGSVMTIAINSILCASTAALSVYGIYFKLQSFVFMPVFGLNQGVLPIIAYNFGAKNRGRIISALKIGTLIAAVIMACGTAVFMIFPRQLLAVFNSTDEMYKIGIKAMRTISLCFIPAAVGIVFSTLFQALGHGMKSLIISLLRQLIIIVPLAYFLSKISLNSVWYAFPSAEIISLCVSIFMFTLVYKGEIKPLGRAAA